VHLGGCRKGHDVTIRFEVPDTPPSLIAAKRGVEQRCLSSSGAFLSHRNKEPPNLLASASRRKTNKEQILAQSVPAPPHLNTRSCEARRHLASPRFESNPSE
jgi:hypothetical protein